MTNFHDRRGTAFTVKRATITPGVSVTKTWQNISTTNKGVLSDLSGFMARKYERKYAESTHVLFCGVIDIKTDDRIVFESLEYEVANVSNPAQMDHHLEVELKLYK
ncbi:MAG: hypothetical protein HYS25_13785 [Ignavibacteriales bacterium]|nr:hypothetical protein [Ignavibacteriales bacterium]